MDVKIKVALIGLAGVVLVAIIGGLFGLYQSSKGSKGKIPSSVTHGPQSPIFNIFGDFKGTINLDYGIPQSIIDRWEQELKKNNIKDEIHNKKIQELVNKYIDFIKDLSKRSPERSLSKKTFNKIYSGKFHQAEVILEMRFDNYQQQKDFSAAAAIADDLKILKELQLQDSLAKFYGGTSTELKNLNGQNVSQTEIKEKIPGAIDENEIKVHTKPSEREVAKTPGKYFSEKKLFQSYLYYGEYERRFLLERFESEFCYKRELSSEKSKYRLYIIKRVYDAYKRGQSLNCELSCLNFLINSEFSDIRTLSVLTA